MTWKFYVLLLAVVTQKWNRYQNKSQHRKLTIEKKSYCHSCPESKLWPSDHEYRALRLSYPHPVCPPCLTECITTNTGTLVLLQNQSIKYKMQLSEFPCTTSSVSFLFSNYWTLPATLGITDLGPLNCRSQEWSSWDNFPRFQSFSIQVGGVFSIQSWESRRHWLKQSVYVM